MKKYIKSFKQVLSANFLLMGIGIVQAFIIPSVLDPINYGYWSLYTLYIGYAGLLVFGFSDGIYLKYSGTNYKDIDKKQFSTFFYFLLAYLLSILVLWMLGIDFIMPAGRKKIVVLLIGVGAVLSCIIGFFMHINQATSRFRIFSKGKMIEKTVLLIALPSFLLFFSINVYYVVFAAIIGKLLTVVYFTYHSKDIILVRPSFNKEVFSSITNNISIGFTLTLAGLGSMMMKGFGKIVVDRQLGVEQLGYYSLMFSVSALFTQLMYAMTTVLFPILRKMNTQKSKIFLADLDTLFVNFSGLILMCYFPIRFFLQLIFPEYENAMNNMLFLTPIVVIQYRISIVYNVSYKLLMLQNKLFKNVIVALAFCIALTLFLMNIYPAIETVAFGTYISLYFWKIISKIGLRNAIDNNTKLINLDLLIVLLYIYFHYSFGYSLVSFISTFLIVIIHQIITYKSTKSIIGKFRKIIKESENDEKNSYTDR